MNGGKHTSAIVMIVLVIEGPKIAAMMIANNKLGYDIKISLNSITTRPKRFGQKAAAKPRQTPTMADNKVAAKPMNNE